MQWFEKQPGNPPELGLFLEETWRLPPSICKYTSEVFYENRLHPRPHCKHQKLIGPTPFAGAGLFLVHSEHEGNQSVSHEEVECVRRVVEELLKPGVQWIDGQRHEHALGREHILVIAPYNAQVTALSAGLPGIDVGMPLPE